MDPIHMQMMVYLLHLIPRAPGWPPDLISGKILISGEGLANSPKSSYLQNTLLWPVFSPHDLTAAVISLLSPLLDTQPFLDPGA